MSRFLTRNLTKIRLSIGLTSISVTFMLIASFFGVFPDSDKLNVEAHKRVAMAVAANGTLLVSQGDIKRMEAILSVIVDKDSGLQQAIIKTKDGGVVASVGEVAAESSFSSVSVPIWSGADRWGTITLSFTQTYTTVWSALYKEPLARFILFVSALTFLAFFFYLGRMLKVLDPSQAIPDRVRSALDTMAEGLLVLDHKDNIVLANQAFSNLVDRPQKILVGMNSSLFNWLNIDGSKFVSAQSPWVQAMKTGEAVMGRRVRLRLEMGNTHTFMVNCSPVLSDSGKAGGVLVSFDDVTELEKKELELIRSKEDADRANKSKSEFLANMSHEIRTPMTAIMGFSEVLRRGYGSGEKNLEYLNTITKNSNHLLELINDILDLSKVESGQIEIEKGSVKIYQIVSDVVEVLAISAQNKGIDIFYEPQTDMPIDVVTDPGRIRQIITNLLGNAIKFTESGSVRIKTYWDDSNNRVRIDVIDTGIGMTEAQSASVFDAFVQADSSITRRFGGTGLGLTISKRYAEALGGNISVESQPGQGSCFTLYVDAGAADETTMIPIEGQKNVSDHLSNKEVTWRMPNANIMVVDDCEENRDLIQLLLESQNLSVDTFEGGEIAIRQVAKKTYDMILMDVQMPVMDGYTAVRRLREAGVSIPIYALTAHAMKGIEKKCVAAGFSGYIAKPIKIDLLIETVALCIGGEKQEAQTVDEIPTLNQLELHVSPSGGDEWDLDQKIVSSLQDNAKYLPIISKFVDRFDRQIEDLFEYNDSSQFDDLIALAHKLKGSSGTVGYYEFTEPFHQLEKAAMSTDQTKIGECLNSIKNMSLCIDRSQLNVPSRPEPAKAVR